MPSSGDRHTKAYMWRHLEEGQRGKHGDIKPFASLKNTPNDNVIVALPTSCRGRDDVLLATVIG